MKALVARNAAAHPEPAVAERDKPSRSQPGDVLVKVLAVGLDGTDKEILAGGYGKPPEGAADLVIGHESLGVVEEASAEAGFVPGDLVTALVRRPCRDLACVNCRNGRQDFCQTGDYVERGIKGADGYMAEYYVEDAAYLVKVPAESLAYGVLAEPQSIVEKVWDQVQRIQQRLVWQPKTALVLGSGPLGLLAALTCRTLGLDTYVWSKSADTSEQAEFIRACGGHYRQAGQPAAGTAGTVPAVQAAAQVPTETMSEYAASLGRPVDIVFECSGFSPLAFEAMTALGPGGVLALLGVTPGSRTIELPADAINQALVLENKCIIGSVNAAKRDFETGIYRLQQMEQKFPGILSRFITNWLPIDEVPQLEYSAVAIKAVVEIVPRSEWTSMVGSSSQAVYSFSV